MADNVNRSKPKESNPKQEKEERMRVRRENMFGKFEGMRQRAKDAVRGEGIGSSGIMSRMGPLKSFGDL